MARVGGGRVSGAVAGTLGLLAGLVAVSSAAPAGAAASCAASNTTVTLSTDGGGAGTLRSAITNANGNVGNQTICIDTTLVTGPITLGSDLPAFNAAGSKTLTILGNGATVDGNGHQLITDNSTALLTVDSITLTGANTGLDGGAIDAFGVVAVTNSTLTHNTVSNIGGGIFANNGGGVATAVTMTNSIIANNVVSNSGGGIASNGAVVVTNSTIAGNTATGQFALNGGAISTGGGTGVTITNSTLASNSAQVLGGAVFTNGTVVITNSTLSGNTTSQDGGAVFASSGVTLVYATVVDNSAPTGANLADGGSPLTSFGSVVALPHGGGKNCANLTGASKGWNWDDDGSCGFGGGPGDHSNGGDPQLGALASNGGATQTRSPLTGSRLIDAIPVASCRADGAAGITTDQRGFARPSGAGCDIGAVEVQVTPPAAPVVVTPRFTG